MLLVQRADVLLVIALVIVRDVVEQRRPDDLFRGVAEDGCGMRVDRLDVPVEIVGADDAERAFDQLTIACFAGAQAIKLLALLGDVDAGGDNEVDVALRIVERTRGPGDAAHAAVAGAPVHLVAAVELTGARLLKHAHCVIAFLGRKELFREERPTSSAKLNPLTVSQARLKRTMRPAVSSTSTSAWIESSTEVTKLRSTVSARSMRWRERTTRSCWLVLM